MKSARLVIVAILTGLPVAQAGNASPNTLQVVWNKNPRTMEYRYWNGHPYINVKDTYLLDWIPYLDGTHHLVDIAGCLRLEFASRKLYGVRRSNNIQGIAASSDLNDLKVPTRTVNGEMWIPVDSVAEALGYKASFDAKKQTLTLKVNTRPDDRSFPGYCQYVLQQK